jgi:hypothetical protein
MPSFDIVSEINSHELTNAIDQCNREITTRFDFKGVKASYEHQEDKVLLKAENEFQLKQMLDILKLKCSKRNIDVQCLEEKEVATNLNEARQEVIIKQGIEKDLAKKIIKIIKDNQSKVQSAIQGEQIRVTGKKRDDLQDVIALLRQQDLGLPLQFTNFRD